MGLLVISVLSLWKLRTDVDAARDALAACELGTRTHERDLAGCREQASSSQREAEAAAAARSLLEERLSKIEAEVAKQQELDLRAQPPAFRVRAAAHPATNLESDCKNRDFEACGLLADALLDRAGLDQLCADGAACACDAAKLSDDARRQQAIQAGGSGCPGVARAGDYRGRDGRACYVLAEWEDSARRYPAALKHYWLSCVSGYARGCREYGWLLRRHGLKTDAAEQSAVAFATACVMQDSLGCAQLAWAFGGDLATQNFMLGEACRLGDVKSCDEVDRRCTGGRELACRIRSEICAYDGTPGCAR